ncbi:hypothetical protein [Spongiimicrobium sp. 3-5]
MKAINIKTDKPETLNIERVPTSKRLTWNGRRRHSFLSTQFKFL